MTMLNVWLAAVAIASGPNAGPSTYFKIRVVDDQTGRGVPLVELSTVHGVTLVTDSNGVAAFHEPGLMGRDVFFFVRSHGYAFPADGFGMHGRSLRVDEGGSAELKIRRVNIAQRLYRITGGGIYRDSVLTGHPVPIREPVLCGDVLGQDSIQGVAYRGKLYWFWGDTAWPKYPLGNFRMTGATSLLPGQGGLDPEVGIDLTYFVRDDGFAKEMAPRPEPGAMWLDGFVVLPDDAGSDGIYAAYARVTSAMEALERGFMRYNDDAQVFEKIDAFDVNAAVRPGGHPFLHRDNDAMYVWFPTPFPLVRVRASAAAYIDLDQYEAWTPLAEGSTLDDPVLDRDASGRLRYAWRRHTPALDHEHEQKLIQSGRMAAAEAWIQLQDVETGKTVVPHAGSVYFNAYRGRWITIRCELFGSSLLGETWYAEADTPLGPWVYARKIVTHDKYSFYNPRHHPVFDKDGGGVIYFEGTYSRTFSGRDEPTPRYDYNQIMYRLDLADERLVLPVPVYRTAGADEPGLQPVVRRAPAREGFRLVAFFALDRPVGAAVAVCQTAGTAGGARLSVMRGNEIADPESEVLFYALPADTEHLPATTMPLYEFAHEERPERVYSTDPEWSRRGYRRSETPICLVWRNPADADRRWN